MVWLAFAGGWVIGSVTLYLYMIATAKEPEDDRCVDCTLSACRECPYEDKTGRLVTGRAA